MELVQGATLRRDLAAGPLEIKRLLQIGSQVAEALAAAHARGVVHGDILYEIVEWLVAIRVDPGAGLAFLGTQGDVWDTQKDMFAAAAGAFLAMLAVVLISWKRNPEFAAEMRSSFRLHPAELPADERTLGPAIESPEKPRSKRR
jgi:hypothetical protein